jgi:protein-S-isoprenylcysteine O-methyltransferase Ste14
MRDMPRRAEGTRKNLHARAWLGLAVLAVATALLLFVPAGTVHYWQAWVYLLLFIGASALTTLFLMKRDPALLERRIRAGPTAETRPVQKIIMLVTSLGFIALLVVPALDHRYRWTTMPPSVVAVGDALVIIGFLLIARVYRENTFTSATVQVVESQRVISTGPYAIVRHPMYASAFLYLVGTPLALGSYWGLGPIAAMVPFLIWRLLDEERLLTSQLPGYADYRTRVRHRLVPFVW